jgi:hypothetical protein
MKNQLQQTKKGAETAPSVESHRNPITDRSGCND